MKLFLSMMVAFFKINIRTYCTFDDGTPWHHVSNKHWFTDNNQGKHAHSEFTFLLWKARTELPEFFKSQNPTIQPIRIGDFDFYEVSPYRFYIDGGKMQPILISK